MEAAVGDRALVHPAAEHRADRAPELILDVLRERLAEFVEDDLLEAVDHGAPVGGGEVGVVLDADVALGVVQHVLEQVAFDAQHDVGIHLDEAAVAVVGEAFVVRALRETEHGGVVEAEIEDGVHHSRHRGARTRAHRDQKRVLRIAEAHAERRLDVRERRLHRGVEAIGIGVAVAIIIGADLGRDRETGRHRHADPAHLRQVRALTPQQVAHCRASLGLPIPEGVYPLRHGRVPRRVAQARVFPSRGD